ncbi:hypothetical protein BASA62_000869 [Batrachochytrium salamandrivorans]|nr:hypothetical protein BASA62_000869 [Batrachochytrium salamandrivorans]
MRLISFAIVSLLAIAVSAHPPPNTSAGDDTPQYTQEEIDAELAQPKGRLSREKNGTLDDAKRQRLEVALKGASEDFEKARGAVLVKQQQLEDAKEGLGVAKVQVLVLTENQRQIEEHNAENTQDLMTVSTGCYYNKRVLDQQVKEACEEAEGASSSSQNIDDGSSKFDEVIQRRGSGIAWANSR